MKITANPDGKSVTLTVEDGDELAPFTIYRGPTVTYPDVPIRNPEVLRTVLAHEILSLLSGEAPA